MLGGTHLVSLGFIWIYLEALALTWIHLDSLGFTKTHLDNGKGEGCRGQRENGKCPPTLLQPDLTRHTHRAYTRTTRNETIPRLDSPPTSDHETTIGFLLFNYEFVMQLML